MIDPYDTLGIEEGADSDTVARAFRAQVRKVREGGGTLKSKRDRIAELKSAYSSLGATAEASAANAKDEPVQAPEASAGSDWPQGLPYDVEMLAWALVDFRNATHDAFTAYRTANDANLARLLKGHNELSERLHQYDLKLYRDLTSLANTLSFGEFATTTEFADKLNLTILMMGLKPDDVIQIAFAMPDYETDRREIRQKLSDDLQAARDTIDSLVRGL